MASFISSNGDRERSCRREAVKNSLERGYGGRCIPPNCPRRLRENGRTFPDPGARQ